MSTVRMPTLLVVWYTRIQEGRVSHSKISRCKLRVGRLLIFGTIYMTEHRSVVVRNDTGGEEKIIIRRRSQ